MSVCVFERSWSQKLNHFSSKCCAYCDGYSDVASMCLVIEHTKFLCACNFYCCPLIRSSTTKTKLDLSFLGQHQLAIFCLKFMFLHSFWPPHDVVAYSNVHKHFPDIPAANSLRLGALKQVLCRYFFVHVIQSVMEHHDAAHFCDRGFL